MENSIPSLVRFGQLYDRIKNSLSLKFFFRLNRKFGYENQFLSFYIPHWTLHMECTIILHAEIALNSTTVSPDKTSYN